jgi:hypothetical protein
MGPYIGYRDIESHQATLRADRYEQYLAEQVLSNRPRSLMDKLRRLTWLPIARRGAAPQPAGTQAGASPSVASSGLH